MDAHGAVLLSATSTAVPTEDAIDIYAEWMASRGRAALTIRKRVLRLRRTEARLPCGLLGARAEHIDAWALRRHHEISPGSWHVEVADVRDFYRKWAYPRRLVRDDPTIYLESPKLKKGLPRPLPMEAVRHALSQAATPDDAAIIILGLEQGIRRMEIAGADWTNIDLHVEPFGLIRVLGKGNKERAIKLSERAREALLALPHRRGAVIRRRDGGLGNCSPDSIGKRANDLLKPYGTLHQLRHSAGTALVKAGGIRQAQEILGHASPAMTALYSQVTQDEAGEVVIAASEARWSTASGAKRRGAAGRRRAS